MIRREGFGHHDRPDLLFINYKLIDEIGHKFTASSPEEGDCVHIQDANLPVLIRFLDRQVGKGKWALLITADHGHSANPALSGAFRIKVDSVESRLQHHFDPSPGSDPLIQKVRPHGEEITGTAGLLQTSQGGHDIASGLIQGGRCLLVGDAHPLANFIDFPEVYAHVAPAPWPLRCC